MLRPRSIRRSAPILAGKPAAWHPARFAAAARWRGARRSSCPSPLSCRSRDSTRARNPAWPRSDAHSCARRSDQAGRGRIGRRSRCAGCRARDCTAASSLLRTRSRDAGRAIDTAGWNPLWVVRSHRQILDSCCSTRQGHREIPIAKFQFTKYYPATARQSLQNPMVISRHH